MSWFRRRKAPRPLPPPLNHAASVPPPVAQDAPPLPPPPALLGRPGHSTININLSLPEGTPPEVMERLLVEAMRRFGRES